MHASTDDARAADYNLSPTRWVTRRGDKDDIACVDSLLDHLLELDVRTRTVTSSLERILDGVRDVSA